MSYSVYFNNRQISLPGAYSTIVSGETNPARSLDYGKLLIIDTGKFGANFGGGAGINGELANGQDAIYVFQNLSDFRKYQKGGMFWKIAEALFTPDPSNPAAIGISELYFVRAATTKAASMKFTTSGYESERLDEISRQHMCDTVVTHTAPSWCEMANYDRLLNLAKNDPSLLDDVDRERHEVDKIYEHLKAAGHPMHNWIYGHFHNSWHADIDGTMFSMLDCEELKQIY